MTTFDTSRTLATGTSFGDRATRLFADLHGKAFNWMERRQTRNMLASLTDRELDDIGLSRGDIDSLT